MSTFLNNLYKQRKIRELSQLENIAILQEDSNIYYAKKKLKKYNIGDIIFVKSYIYKNGIKGQNHMFLIIEQSKNKNMNFGMLISSKIQKSKYLYNIEIKRNSTNGLKCDSIIKTDVVYKIPAKQILFKVGVVENYLIEEYKRIVQIS